MSNLRDVACPGCGEYALTIEERPVARDVGTFSLAGAQTKFSATMVPHLVCTACGISAPAKSSS